jgi:hypothetical protein
MRSSSYGVQTRPADSFPLRLLPQLSGAHETYLGDGLFASWDGWQVRLRAPRENGDHVVFLEDGLTLEAFLEFLDTLPIKRA